MDPRDASASKNTLYICILSSIYCRVYMHIVEYFFQLIVWLLPSRPLALGFVGRKFVSLSGTQNFTDVIKARLTNTNYLFICVKSLPAELISQEASLKSNWAEFMIKADGPWLSSYTHFVYFLHGRFNFNMYQIFLVVWGTSEKSYPSIKSNWWNHPPAGKAAQTGIRVICEATILRAAPHLYRRPPHLETFGLISWDQVAILLARIMGNFDNIR